MDADDAEKIDEQLQLLQNKQKTIQHATKNQIKILNATIGHLKSLEETLNYNEDRITNVTKRIQKKLISTVRREDVEEHLLLLSTIMTDLINDIKDIIDFLTYTKHQIILTHLLPVEKIITELREASTLLTNGLHFPFRIQDTNWRIIQTYVTVIAHYNHPKIYVTLKFPIIAYPIYEIIKILPLPVHKHANVFILIKTTYPLLAIDRENRHYLLLSENDLNKCTQDHTKYTCEQNWPMYHAQADAPCEVQVYVHTPQRTDNCEKGHVLTNTTIWIALTEPRSWLYSTPVAQEISINCNQKENKILINNTGKITLAPNCRLTTSEITLKTTNQIKSKFITAHLPKFNINRISENIVNNKYNKNPTKL